MDGSNKKATPFQKAFIEALSKHLKSVIRRCPYPVDAYKMNIRSIDRKFTMILPEGVYRICVLIFNKIDSVMVAISVLVELES
jgi:hypothetical protein